MKFVVAFAVPILFFAAWTTGCAERGAEAPPPAAQSEGTAEAPQPTQAAPAVDTSQFKMAPEFTLATVAGGEMSLASLRGKVVFVDFWATWCPPCRRGIPHLEKLHKEHKDDGLVILGLTVDQAKGSSSPSDLVREFMKRQPMSYPNLLVTDEVRRAYGGIRSIPTAFLIDREGRIRQEYVGLQPPQVLDRDIAALLAEKPGESETI